MAKNETEYLQALNDAFKALENMEPLIPFEDVGKEITAEMREGLARAYALPGFRKFLAYKYNRAVKLTALTSVSLVDQAAGKARALTYKEILRQGLQMFVEFDRINKLRPKRRKRS